MKQVANKSVETNQEPRQQFTYPKTDKKNSIVYSVSEDGQVFEIDSDGVFTKRLWNIWERRVDELLTPTFDVEKLCDYHKKDTTPKNASNFKSY